MGDACRGDNRVLRLIGLQSRVGSAPGAWQGSLRALGCRANRRVRGHCRKSRIPVSNWRVGRIAAGLAAGMMPAGSRHDAISRRDGGAPCWGRMAPPR